MGSRGVWEEQLTPVSRLRDAQPEEWPPGKSRKRRKYCFSEKVWESGRDWKKSSPGRGKGMGRRLMCSRQSRQRVCLGVQGEEGGDEAGRWSILGPSRLCQGARASCGGAQRAVEPARSRCALQEAPQVCCAEGGGGGKAEAKAQGTAKGLC